MLVTTDENRDKLKEYEKIWRKVKDIIRSTNNNPDDYDEKYIKLKFNLVDDVPPKRNTRTV